MTDDPTPMTDDPTPLVRTDGLSLRGSRGPVFEDVSLEIYPGRLVVVLGRSGSGRSALLLAVAGRMKGLSGAGTFDGLSLLDQPGKIAARVSVARISGLIDLEPQLTVADSIMERALTDGVRPDEAEDTVREFADRLDLGLDPTMLVTELSRLDQGRLTAALACLRPADLIVFDDVDRDLDLDEQRSLYAALTTVAATGPAVLASTVIADTVPVDSILVTLPDHHRAIRTAAPAKEN